MDFLGGGCLAPEAAEAVAEQLAKAWLARTPATRKTRSVQRETRYARSGDVAIAYRILGDGPFDVVYHPGVVSHVELMTEMPTYQGRIVGALARFSRVIVFDQRGVGMSDRMNGTPGLETRMDDVRAVMDAAGSSRAAIVSASIGVLQVSVIKAMGERLQSLDV